jgi:quercetin dioxygenase-like cupin family protein
MYLSLRSFLIVAIAATFVANVANAGDATEIRTPPSVFDFSKAEGAGAGTSGVSGIQTIVLKGDPTKHGLYTILLRVPAYTKIAAHHHPDDRIATVVSGTWYFGYGAKFNETLLRALPPGSFYTEPPNDNHFAETRDEDALVQISGLGPTGTTYVDVDDNPKH